MFRNKTATMPTICQECLLCANHGLPFQQIVTGGVENFAILQQYDEATSDLSGTPTCNEHGVPTQGIVYSSLIAGPLPITVSLDHFKDRVNVLFRRTNGKRC